MKEMSYGAQELTHLWLPEPYVVGVSATYVGRVGPSVVMGAVGALVGGAGSQSIWLPGPTSCSDCQPADGGGGVGPDMADCMACGLPGLVPAHW